MSIPESELVDRLFPYTRSVFGAINKATPEFVGSGFLLKGHDGLYLVTAAHVMDRFCGNEYGPFLDGADGLVAISGEEVCSYTGDPIRRRDDRRDVSIVKLDNETQRRLGQVYIADYEKLDLLGEHDVRLGYFCVGVPAKKGQQRIDTSSRVITPEPYGLFASESSAEIYGKLNADKAAHLAIAFNVKKSYAQDNVRRAAPALHGLSGAPIWGFRRKSDAELQAVIVAILTEYHQKDIKAILGTRVREVFLGDQVRVAALFGYIHKTS